MLVQRQLVDLVIEFETASCNPVGMASGPSRARASPYLDGDSVRRQGM
jgi:hypothetical protein